MTATVSVIIPAKNEGANLIDTVGVVLAHSEWEPLEVIVVDDGSDDGSTAQVKERFRNATVRVVSGPGAGVAGARNAGARVATGEFLVFLDGHCYVPPGWLVPLVESLGGTGVGMVGPAFSNIRDDRILACGVTWEDPGLGNVWLPCGVGEYPVPFHIGACQAVRADVFRSVDGYDGGMTRWGSEDIELCLRLWLMGFQVLARPDSIVYHLFRTSRPYEVDVMDIIYNQLRMALLHFDEPRLQRVISHLLSIQGVERSLTRAYTDGTLTTRGTLRAKRKHHPDWFFHKFSITV